MVELQPYVVNVKFLWNSFISTMIQVYYKVQIDKAILNSHKMIGT